jgi:hypothetical protein
MRGRHAEPAAEGEGEAGESTEESTESTGIGTVEVTRLLVLVVVLLLDTAQLLCLTLAALTSAQVRAAPVVLP